MKRDIQIELAKNIAANGRLFCAMVFALNCLALLITHYKLFAFGAIAAVLAVGCAIPADACESRLGRAISQSVAYLLAIAALVLFIVNMR